MDSSETSSSAAARTDPPVGHDGWSDGSHERSRPGERARALAGGMFRPYRTTAATPAALPAECEAVDWG